MEAAQRAEVQRAMIALSQGERAAFRPVFTVLWPLLRRFSLGTLGDPALAEDAAQAALTKLFLHATEFDPKRDALVWALGFASFEVLSLRKRKWRRERFDLADPAVQDEVKARFVPLSLDMSDESDATDRLAKTYGIPGLPTVVIMVCQSSAPKAECTPPREGQGRLTGYVPPSEMLEFLQAVR